MIVITTPTGNIGHHVVEHLHAAGEPLRIVVRDTNKLPESIRDQAEVVEGSHGDLDVVNRAFHGAEALFWVVPPTPAESMHESYSGFSQPAADAVRRYGIRRVVVVTALGRNTPWQHKAGLVTASLRMVDVFNETGASVRGLAMPGFMENALQQVAAIKEADVWTARTTQEAALHCHERHGRCGSAPTTRPPLDGTARRTRIGTPRSVVR